MSAGTGVARRRDDGSAVDRQRPGVWTALRPLLLRLHFSAGVLVGPFVVVAALTGGLYALATPLERLLYAEQLLVQPADRVLPLAEQVRLAQEATQVEGLVGLRPSPAADASTRVLFDDGTLGDSTLHAVFVDPGTGEVLGQERVYGTSGSLPVRTWVAELHRSLHLGTVGRHYSELAASWLWVVALGGSALWLGRLRRRRGQHSARQHSARQQPARHRTRSRHGALGVWLVLGLLALSATGLTWSRWAGANVSDARSALGWEAPAVSAALDPAAARASGEHAHHGTGAAAPTTRATAEVGDVDEVLAAVRGSGLTSSQIEVRLPETPDHAWTVTEVHRAFPTQVDAAAVHPQTLQVLDVVRFSDYPVMAKLARWGVDLHMGAMFGLPNQLALAAFSVAVVVLVLLGYRAWWQRRPRGATGLRPGAAYPRGAWRQAPRWAVLLVVVAAVAVGWALPLLGGSLLAFLLLDAALGWWSRRRDRRAGTGTTGSAADGSAGAGPVPRQRPSAAATGALLATGAVLAAVPLALLVDRGQQPAEDSVEVAFARDSIALRASGGTQTAGGGAEDGHEHGHRHGHPSASR